MTINKSDIVAKIRKAIDDILPTGMSDSFTSNTDDELWQAACQAVQALLMELPLDLLQPKTGTSITPGTADNATTVVIDDLVRFVNVQLSGWLGLVSELMEPDSDEAKRQRSTWSRGSSSKPRVMLLKTKSGSDTVAKSTLYCWPSGTVTQLNYIPTATINTTSIDCAIRSEAERLVIYRAASIYFEGKKEDEIADKFRNLS